MNLNSSNNSLSNSPNSQNLQLFSPDQQALFKNQIIAFKSLMKNKQIPPQIQNQLFNPNVTSAFQVQQPQGHRSTSNSGSIPPQPISRVPSSTGIHTPQQIHSRNPSATPDLPNNANPQISNPNSPGIMSRNQSIASQSPAPTNASPPAIQQLPQTQQTSQQLVRKDSVPIQTTPLEPPPPKTLYEKLGVSGYVDPESYLPEYLDISKPPAELSDDVSFIPSLMPLGVNIAKIKNLREMDINTKIFNRLVELYPKVEPLLQAEADKVPLTEEQLSMLIEFKSLTLLNKQKALRGDILADMYYFNTVRMNETSQIFYTRMKQTTIQECLITEKFDVDQRTQRKLRENQLKREYLKNTCAHAKSIKAHEINNGEKRRKFGRNIMSFHSFTEKEEQKRAERTAKQRLQALKANDEEAYIKLLDQTKDTRITHLLKQTNSFLDSLAQAVKNQQRETMSIATDADDGTNKIEELDNNEEDEVEEVDKEKIDYYAVAHRIKETVTKQPSILVGGTLKEYQLKGLQWMVSLYNNNLNGILADEMGLGKTIQTISLITYLIEVKKVHGPYLVIVPLSTLTNWTLEFERWAPSVKKVVYKGPPLARRSQQAIIKSGDFQVVLTTYEYVIKDRPLLSKIKWVHMIIDEGHRMKNTQSKLSYTLTTYYSTKYRLILTGTPLQNNLPELWALLNFVLPKIFNSVKSFDEWFNTPFANTGGQDKMGLSEEETLLIIRRLHKVLRPFLLRRLKKDVEKDLPDKVEKVLKCKMSALQTSLYQQILRFKKMFIGDGKGNNPNSAKGLNNKLMQLKKVCNHPFVFEPVEHLINPTQLNNALLWRTAGKFELLDRVLPKFHATNHRVLIFFQMTQIMDIMEDFMRLLGYQYLRLDGGTKADERSDLLKKFNAPDSPYFAFLLSTRAGGLGLNLQTADTVIIFDTDWNPHQDLQAQDRAHRIGQTKEVRILRLITENSVEEHILDRAHKKLDIDGKVIQAGKFDNKSTNEEQEAFLRHLLEQEELKRLHKNEEEEELDDDELNEILARNDEERLIFRKIDEEREAKCPYGKGKQFDRLFSEAELPETYKEEFLKKEEMAEPEVVDHNQYGRGARERKVTHYDDGLTEEQWLEAMDNDDDTPEEATARKRARIEKRRANKLKRENDRGSNGTNTPRGNSVGAYSRSPSYADPSSPTPFLEPSKVVGDLVAAVNSGVKRKRGRKSKADSEAVAAASAAALSDALVAPIPLRKKSKGRPPKVKETLTPEARLDLTNKMCALYNHILSLKDEETGRSRVDLFMELPSKRLYADYYVLIQNPIAMDIINKRINNRTYQRLGEFRADFQLMFDNARKYNTEGSLIYEDANIMEKEFNKKLNELLPGNSDDASKVSSNTGEDNNNKPESFPNGGSAIMNKGIDGIMTSTSSNGSTTSLPADSLNSMNSSAFSIDTNKDVKISKGTIPNQVSLTNGSIQGQQQLNGGGQGSSEDEDDEPISTKKRKSNDNFLVDEDDED